jgi:hypothetical protein
MSAGAMEGACLADLIRRAIPLCQAAERECPRQGPGRKPEIPDWVLAVLIVVAVLKHRKSKSAQYRFLAAHRVELLAVLGVARWPARSTYFDRYRRAWRLLEIAIRLAGRQAVRRRLVRPRCVAVDKSVVPARGPLWNKRHVARRTVKPGADLEATWTYSGHHGWSLGYAYEVVVSAEKSGPVWPLLASASPASWQPPRTFPQKAVQLPDSTRYVLADTGYESNQLADAVELDSRGRPTGRRLLCPYQARRRGDALPQHKENRARCEKRLCRRSRREFFERPLAQSLFRRRGTRVEPFNDWLKTRFDLHDRAWHRGLDNNRTQLLAAIFGYQLLLFYNHACGRHNGQIQWILDSL